MAVKVAGECRPCESGQCLLNYSSCLRHSSHRSPDLEIAVTDPARRYSGLGFFSRFQLSCFQSLYMLYLRTVACWCFV